MHLNEPISLADFEALARDELPAAVWDYYAGGAGDEVTLRENRAAFDRIRLLYRVMVDVSVRDTSTAVFGRRISMPLLVAPTAFQRLAHADGELATARAAGDAGTVMILSTLSTTPVEKVAAATSGPLWFQLYIYKDRDATRGLVERVEAAGAEALVLTVDAPVLGKRELEVRNRFSLPDGLSMDNLLPAGLERLPAAVEGSGLAAYFASLLDPGLTWYDIDWLRQITKLPILVKGVVRPDDALRAIDHGAAGVIVSNHGGRQLDTAPPTTEVLGPVCAALGGRAEVFVDGGIRRGTDVIKALALGARAVLLGRPILWGLAAGGRDGVARVLAIMQQEIDLAMALCGCPTTADISRDLLG